MNQSIKDKILIFLLTIAAIVLVAKDVAAIHVCVALGAIIIASIDEIFKQRYVAFVLVVASILSLFLSPYATMMIPILIYVLVSKSKSYEYIAALVVFIFGMVKSMSFEMGTLLFIISATAAYIAYFNNYYKNTINRSNVLFDEARREAFDNARKRRELREKADSEIYTARLKERNRIAREIHDNVGHMLTRAVVQMQAILVINKDENMKPLLESVNSTVNEAMTNIRRSVHELHDDSIDLSIGINELALTLKDRFEVNVSTSLESPVSNEVKMQIIGIIKEAVTNISKHSNGSKVNIEVVENVTFWRIEVFDNGSSSELELSGSSDFAALGGDHGIGLSNINSRAESLKGRTTVTGGKNGFKIMVTIPKR